MSEFIKAKKIAETGNFDSAWEIAKTDSGLLPHVTKTVWVNWMKALLSKQPGENRAGGKEKSAKQACFS